MAKPTADQMRIEYQPLSEVLRAPRNPKLHDDAQMDASIERHGFNDPPTLDERTGKLVEGHGRIEALQRRKNAGKAPPPRVEARKDGEWLLPIVRGVAFKSEKDAEAYLLAHNKIGEGLWDSASLSAALAEQEDLSGLGWTDEEAMKLIAAAEANEIEPGDIEALEQDRITTGAVTGDAEVSHVRMVQLFLNVDTQPRFMVAVKKLAATFGTKTVTDTVLQAVEDLAARQAARGIADAV